MKHFLLIALLLSAMLFNVDAQTLSFRAIGTSEAEVTKCSGGVRVEVPSSTQINGQSYRVVSIGAYAFCNNRTLQYVTLPTTLLRIGEKAFAQCSELKEITITNSVTWIGRTAFAGCTQLTAVTLPTKAQYDLEGGFKTFEGCRSIAVINGTVDERLFESDCASYSFSSYAKPRIQAMVAQWQIKDEFETSAQWRARVTQENRQAKAREFTSMVRQEFIEANKRPITQQTIGAYDADNGIFPISVKSGDADMGIIYVSVSLDEAKTFKQKFAQVKLLPEYGVVNDKVGVVSCTFTLDGRSYSNATSYTAQDNSNELSISLPPLELNLDDSDDSQQSRMAATVDNSVDVNIPVNEANNNRTFALIIGNENYQRVSNVAFAKNDAKVFADYCRKTLGLPSENVLFETKATYGSMMSKIKTLKEIAEAYKGDIKIIFYYAGHGIPNESTLTAYLLPVDADGSQTEVCLAVSELYSKLNDMHAQQVLVFMDACFSGSQRGNGMLATASTRGVALRVRNDRPVGNTVVFSAATGDQTAFPYDEKQHGMFTYFLLKKLQDNRGNVTLGELADYISDNVVRQSIVINHKSQTPTVTPAETIVNSWRICNIK